eukprot:m.253724 g.253724  ORF g.253724 m.253724 type:complete len:54 (+) comp16163_c0_seq2:1731-1892(+)
MMVLLDLVFKVNQINVDVVLVQLDTFVLILPEVAGIVEMLSFTSSKHSRKAVS